MRKSMWKLFCTGLLVVLGLFCFNPLNVVEAATYGDYEYQLINDGAEVEIIGYNGPGGDIVIPSEIEGTLVTKIGNLSFGGKNLESVIIPDCINIIGSYAFADNQLTNVVIPNSVTDIGNYAFRNNQINSLKISASINIINPGVFYKNRLANITIPEGVSNIGSHAFGDNQLISIIIPDSVVNLSGFSDNLLDDVSIPKSVSNIGDYAFTNNRISSVTIPEGVINIGENAFGGNELTDIIIPSNIKTIGDRAFTFNNLNSAVISDGVTSIGDRAFFANKLTSIIIPASINFIGKEAFSGNQYNPKDFIIYGEPESKAESYANTFGHTFLSSTIVDIEAIDIAGENDRTIIDIDNGTLQMAATIFPENATNKEVNWSVESITGEATINQSGMLKAIKNGIVTVTASANDGSDVSRSIDITITNQIEWDIWEPKYNVEPDKTWTIEFNKTLDIDTIKQKNLYVTDQVENILPMFYYQANYDIDKKIYIIPMENYESGQTYTLWIKDLKSSDGSILNKYVKMDFTIE